MAAGTRIISSGNPIQYANGSIAGGLTKSLLSVFTDVSSATPSSGDEMYPQTFTGPNPAYSVIGGTYGRNYFINRNNPTGSTIWSNINSNGLYAMGDFYEYTHWPTDNRYVTIMVNMSPDDIYWQLKIVSPSQTILSDTIPATTNYDPSSGVPYFMAAGVGSAGAFSMTSINADWNIEIYIQNTTQIQPTDVRITLRDYNTNEPIFNDNAVLDPGTSWEYNNTVLKFQYYRIANWLIECS
jgi:hypothetical protein